MPLDLTVYLDIALAAGAHGVHLGQSDLDVRSARRLAGPGFLVGLSVSCAYEIAAVQALPAGTVDYLGIGPVFPTSTKDDTADALGLDAAAALRTGSTLPCVAIGGITRRNARSVWATAMDGLAVVSAICDAADPRAATMALKSSRP